MEGTGRFTEALPNQTCLQWWIKTLCFGPQKRVGTDSLLGRKGEKFEVEICAVVQEAFAGGIVFQKKTGLGTFRNVEATKNFDWRRRQREVGSSSS